MSACHYCQYTATQICVAVYWPDHAIDMLACVARELFVCPDCRLVAIFDLSNNADGTLVNIEIFEHKEETQK